MGRAVVIEHVGESLYRVQLLRDTRRATAQLATAEARLIEVDKAIPAGEEARRDAVHERDQAREALSAAIELHKAGLLVDPPEISPDDPIDPETGEPWSDPGEGVASGLMDAINAHRAASSLPELTISDLLSGAAGKHLAEQSNARKFRLRTYRRSPRDMAIDAGFSPLPSVPVLMFMNGGASSTAEVLAGWIQTSGVDLLSPDVTHVGAAYLRTPGWYGYAWAAIAAAEGPPITPAPIKIEDEDADPVESAREEDDESRGSVETPDTDDPATKPLGDAAREFAEAAHRLRIVEKALSELRIERANILKRRDELNALIATPGPIIHAWGLTAQDFYAEGQTVSTWEGPGYLRSTPERRLSLFGYRMLGRSEGTPMKAAAAAAGTYTTYDDFDVYVVPTWFESAGLHDRLVPSDLMSDSGVFYNCAIEPGHLRHAPIIAFGKITAFGTPTTGPNSVGSALYCNVQVEPQPVRGLPPREAAMQTAALGLIQYAPIAVAAWHEMRVDDEVILANADFFDWPLDTSWFDGGAWISRWTVVGWRREPWRYPGGRVGWSQLV